MKIVLIQLFLTFTCTLSSQNNFAIFFANDDYSNNSDFGNLKNPVRDAEAIALELKEMYGFDTMIYRNPTAEKIYTILEYWQNKKFNVDEQLLIFFSGHGSFWDLANKGYFVPSGNLRGFNNYIELTTIGNIVTKIPCEHILLAIDACYSGTIDQEIAFKGVTPRRPGRSTSEKTRLLQTQLRNTTRLLITSGGKIRTPDGKDHSPFTLGILKALRSAYIQGDGLCTFIDILGELQRVTPRPHQGELIGHEDGGFVFASSLNTEAKTSTTSKNESFPLTLATDNSTIIPKGAIIKRTINSFTTNDGETYAFKTMNDGKVWMTKNLNLEFADAWCYKKKSVNCDQFGRLYKWEAAKEACAFLGDGWRLPSDEDWGKMAKQYGGAGDMQGNGGIAAFKALMSSDISGFNAQLGGWRSIIGTFQSVDKFGSYWSTSKNDDAISFYFEKSSGRLKHGSKYVPNVGLSVRCINDNEAINSLAEPSQISNSNDKINAESNLSGNDDYGIFIDGRDNQTYPWKKMKDEKVWMVRNLNYEALYSEYSPNIQTDVERDKYGRLYSWKEAKEACPSGWHLSSDEEWWDLISMYGKPHENFEEMEESFQEGTPEYEAYLALANGGNSGFNAQFGGGYNFINGTLFWEKTGWHGNYWTSTEVDYYNAFYYNFWPGYDTLFKSKENKDAKLSCRCVRDN